MKTVRMQFPVTVMSRVFDVSKSGYFTWLKRAPSKRRQYNARLEVAIKAAHVRTRLCEDFLDLRRLLDCGDTSECPLLSEFISEKAM